MTVLDLIKESIMPELKELGFRKKSLCWNRERGNFIDVLTVQPSKGSSPDHLQFTLNAGVFVPEFYEMVWGKPFDGIVPDADCALRIRVGPVSGGDWWHIASTDEIPEVQAELTSRFRELALSFWNECVSLEDIYLGLRKLGDWKKQYWLTQLYTAIGAQLTGDPSFASTILDELEQSKNSALADKATDVQCFLRSNPSEGILDIPRNILNDKE